MTRWHGTVGAKGFDRNAPPTVKIHQVWFTQKYRVREWRTWSRWSFSKCFAHVSVGGYPSFRYPTHVIIDSPLKISHALVFNIGDMSDSMGKVGDVPFHLRDDIERAQPASSEVVVILLLWWTRHCLSRNSDLISLQGGYDLRAWWRGWGTVEQRKSVTLPCWSVYQTSMVLFRWRKFLGITHTVHLSYSSQIVGIQHLWWGHTGMRVSYFLYQRHWQTSRLGIPTHSLYAISDLR